ncbi:MAG TPA: CbtB-domain containing protein [Chloroflexota bacterium]
MQAHVARPVRMPRAALVAALLALWGLFVLGFDQGQTLALAQGDTAYQLNLIHELVHDARHAAGFPCH